MLSFADLADVINDAIAATDKDGMPITTTAEMQAYAKAVVNSLQASVLNNAPGTVTATGVNGMPVLDGAATNGLIVVLPATWLAELTIGFPTAVPANLSAEATASTTYLTSNSTVDFATGEITGTCTSTPTLPGTLAGGAGTGGEISGLSGNPWSTLVLAALGTSGPLASTIYQAISDYIMDNAEAAYATNSVTGAFAIGGGTMTAGTGVGGTIT